jgi:hypothetical protein
MARFYMQGSSWVKGIRIEWTSDECWILKVLRNVRQIHVMENISQSIPTAQPQRARFRDVIHIWPSLQSHIYNITTKKVPFSRNDNPALRVIQVILICTLIDVILASNPTNKS